MIEVSSRRLPLVPPHHLFPEKPQANRRIEYLDPTGLIADEHVRAQLAELLENLAAHVRGIGDETSRRA